MQRLLREKPARSPGEPGFYCTSWVAPAPASRLVMLETSKEVRL